MNKLLLLTIAFSAPLYSMEHNAQNQDLMQLAQTVVDAYKDVANKLIQLDQSDSIASANSMQNTDKTLTSILAQLAGVIDKADQFDTRYLEVKHRLNPSEKEAFDALTASVSSIAQEISTLCGLLSAKLSDIPAAQ